MSDPFADPPEARDPIRRVRGRLAAPVTLWTAGEGRDRAGLTVSSALVAEGDPALVLGLVGDLTDLWDQVEATGAFVVHVLGQGERALADRFAWRVPAPGGPFAGIATTPSPHGPLLDGVVTRLACRLQDAAPAGYALLVRGTVERVDVGDLDPLVWFRARYRRLADPPGGRRP